MPTSPTVVTVATRMPATMMGSARGSSTVRSRRGGDIPIPSAASVTAAGTPSMPATMFRTRTSRV